MHPTPRVVGRDAQRLDCRGEHRAAPDWSTPAAGWRPTCGLADRPLQPALHLLHAGRGPDWLPHPETLDRRRGRPPGRASASSARASARCGSPAASRCCAAGWPSIVAPHHGARRRARGLPDHQRPRPGPRTAQPLADAGLDRVNVSLDTLDRDALRTSSPGATGSTTCSPGLAAARRRRAWRRSRSTPSLLRGVNDARSVADLLRWCLERGYQLRFIEQMPLDAQHGWYARRDGHRRGDPGRCSRREFTLTPRRRATAGQRAGRAFLVDGGPATVGVIASVTRPFCGDCDRMRLTADGQVRNCLFAREESDLRAAAARRRDRRRARRPLAPAMVGQAGRARHRRPERSSSPTGRCRPSAAEPHRPGAATARAALVTGTISRRNRAGRGSPRGSAGARRRPARPCGARRRAAWGCSSAAMAGAGSPWPSTRRSARRPRGRSPESLRAPDGATRSVPGTRGLAVLAITTAM